MCFPFCKKTSLMAIALRTQSEFLSHYGLPHLYDTYVMLLCCVIISLLLITLWVKFISQLNVIPWKSSYPLLNSYSKLTLVILLSLPPKKGKVRDKILNYLVLWITMVLNKNTISFFSFLFLFHLICWYLNFIHILKKTLLNVTLV